MRYEVYIYARDERRSVGAFRTMARAEAMRNQLESAGKDALVVDHGSAITRFFERFSASDDEVHSERKDVIHIEKDEPRRDGSPSGSHSAAEDFRKTLGERKDVDPKTARNRFLMQFGVTALGVLLLLGAVSVLRPLFTMDAIDSEVETVDSTGSRSTPQAPAEGTTGSEAAPSPTEQPAPPPPPQEPNEATGQAGAGAGAEADSSARPSAPPQVQPQPQHSPPTEPSAPSSAAQDQRQPRKFRSEPRGPGPLGLIVGAMLGLGIGRLVRRLPFVANVALMATAGLVAVLALFLNTESPEAEPESSDAASTRSGSDPAAAPRPDEQESQAAESPTAEGADGSGGATEPRVSDWVAGLAPPPHDRFARIATALTAGDGSGASSNGSPSTVEAWVAGLEPDPCGGVEGGRFAVLACRLERRESHADSDGERAGRESESSNSESSQASGDDPGGSPAPGGAQASRDGAEGGDEPREADPQGGDRGEEAGDDAGAGGAQGAGEAAEGGDEPREADPRGGDRGEEAAPGGAQAAGDGAEGGDEPREAAQEGGERGKEAAPGGAQAAGDGAEGGDEPREADPQGGDRGEEAGDDAGAGVVELARSVAVGLPVGLLLDLILAAFAARKEEDEE